MKRRPDPVRGLARLAAIVAVSAVVFAGSQSSLAAPAPAVSAARASSSGDWAELQAILGGIQGTATAPIPNVTTNKYTPGMLLGNGDIGVVAGGSTTSSQRFYFGKSDFWGSAWNSGHSTLVTAILSLGNLSITSPTASPNPGPVYRMTQDILNAEVRSTVQLGSATVSMRSWTSDSDNVFVTELSTAAGSPAVTLNVGLNLPPPDTHTTYPTTVGATGGTIWATRHNNFTSSTAFQTEDGIAVTPVGVGFSHTATSGSTVTGTFVLSGGSTVELATAFRSDARQGSGGPSAAALASSAVSAVNGLSSSSVAATLTNHRTWWQNFWLRSLVQLNDPRLMAYYYGALYVMGAASRPGRVPPGMNGSWVINDFTAFPRYWMNYNFEAPFYGVASANHADLLLPYTVQQFAEAPFQQANFTARAGYKGVAYQRTFGPFQEFLTPPAPATPAGTKNVHFVDQKSNASFGAMPAIMYYDYTQDQTFLRNQLYPHLKMIDAFWRDYATFDGTHFNIQHSSAKEGGDDLNPINDLAFMQRIEQFLITASQTLGVDQAMVPVWQNEIARLAPWPTMTVGGQTVYDLAQTMNNPTQTNPTNPFIVGDQPIELEGPVFPGELLNPGSDPAKLQIARNSLNQQAPWIANGTKSAFNGFPKTFTEAPRIQWPAADLLTKFDAAILHDWRTSNVTAAQGGGGIETSGSIDGVDSMLMQSEGGVIRLFGDADWPTGKDAHFKRLLAKGAFLVSSEIKSGLVTHVDLTSQVGGSVSVKDPWSTGTPTVSTVDANGNVTGSVSYTLTNGIIQFATTAGQSYTILHG
jgi:hypothetical protein